MMLNILSVATFLLPFTVLKHDAFYASFLYCYKTASRLFSYRLRFWNTRTDLIDSDSVSSSMSRDFSLTVYGFETRTTCCTTRFYTYSVATFLLPFTVLKHRDNSINNHCGYDWGGRDFSLTVYGFETLVSLGSGSQTNGSLLGRDFSLTVYGFETPRRNLCVRHLRTNSRDFSLTVYGFETGKLYSGLLMSERSFQSRLFSYRLRFWNDRPKLVDVMIFVVFLVATFLLPFTVLKLDVSRFADTDSSRRVSRLFSYRLRFWNLFSTYSNHSSRVISSGRDFSLTVYGFETDNNL